MKTAKPIIKLTRKQKLFADKLLENPKLPATDIAQEVYNVANRNVARSIATENLSKPALQIYLDEHVSYAKRRIYDLAKSEKEDIALRASQDIVDRTYGKARQQVDVTSREVIINIDLSGMVS